MFILKFLKFLERLSRNFPPNLNITLLLVPIHPVSVLDRLPPHPPAPPHPYARGRGFPGNGGTAPRWRENFVGTFIFDFDLLKLCLKQ